MFAFTNSTEKISPTIVGAGCKLVGDIKTDHLVQVHGTVQGKVHADTVIIGRGGKITGSVRARDFFLHGTMDGPATVDFANIYADAKMSGTLSYLKLNISSNEGLECRLTKRKGGEDEH